MKKFLTLALLGLTLAACAPTPCDCPDAAMKKPCPCNEKASTAAASMDEDCPMCAEARKQQEAAAKKAKK